MRHDAWTAGLTYLYRDLVKVQLDAYLRDTRDPTTAVPDADAVILGLQVKR